MSKTGLQLHEVLPKQGFLYQEDIPGAVLCKPKILPLKSVTLEKLETLQEEASMMAKQEMQESAREEKETGDGDNGAAGPQPTKSVDRLVL